MINKKELATLQGLLWMVSKDRIQFFYFVH